MVTSYDEQKSLEICNHYKFQKHNINFLNVIELACIFYPDNSGELTDELPEFRDVKGNKEKVQAKVESYQNEVLTRFGMTDFNKLKNEL